MAGEKMLVIDDDKDTIQLITESVLRPHGYSYIVANNGEEGFRLALEKEPDLIITALRTPKMSGLEILETLQAEGRDIPVILMILNGSEETAVQAFRLGVKDYIIKPFEVKEMLEAINRALAGKRLMSKEIGDVDQQLERRVKELNILYSVGKSVTSLLDLEKVLNRIVEAAVFVTEAEEGSLMLVDVYTGELYLRASLGLGEKFARGFGLKVEHSIAGQVVKTGQPILQSTQEEETLKVKTGYLVKSLVNVPLKAKDEVIGVLAVNNKVFSRPFTENDVHLLSALADYATIAIVNAQLYEETKRWSEELEQKVVERTWELRTAYEELQKAQEQMLAAERWAILGKASANLAHRINNTAGLIPVITQDLKELLAGVALEEERRQEIDADLQRVERNTRFTLQMADALFKPFEALPTEECDVNALLEESISAANVPEDVALETQYADELPRVVASRRLADVFVELITNAIKAMPDGGELEIGSRPGEEGWVEVWFSDTGQGIPPESQDKIFDLFFTTSEDSLGFGLWWVKTFLSQQRATIDVESEVGKGTTFTVRLPVKGPQAATG